MHHKRNVTMHTISNELLLKETFIILCSWSIKKGMQ